MKAIDLMNHMKEIGTWVNWKNTTDHFQLGKQDTEVKAVAVVWQARLREIRKAAEMGCNLAVTHEQIFYPEGQVSVKDEIQPYEEEKRKFVRETGMVIIRCHDVWDRMPKIGIVDSWGTHLGLGEAVVRGDVENVYNSPKPTLSELAKYVAKKTKDVGQDSVQMLGDPDAKVSKVAIGCGAGIDCPKMAEMGADVIIATEDGVRFWEMGSWALDRGISMIVVDHCVSEEPGMKDLAKYIGEKFGVRSTHIPQGPMYRTIG